PAAAAVAEQGLADQPDEGVEAERARVAAVAAALEEVEAVLGQGGLAQQQQDGLGQRQTLQHFLVEVQRFHDGARRAERGRQVRSPQNRNILRARQTLTALAGNVPFSSVNSGRGKSSWCFL